MRKVWPSFVVLCLAVACDLGPDDGDDDDRRAPKVGPVSDWPDRAVDASTAFDGGLQLPDGSGAVLPGSDAGSPPIFGNPDASAGPSDAASNNDEDAGVAADAGADAACPPADEDAGEDAGDAGPACEPCTLMLGDVCVD